MAARALDWSEYVEAWLPNARGFDLRLAYEHDGVERSYEPDYVVKLRTPGSHRHFLLIEVKGAGGEIWDEQSVQSKAAAAKRWCQAVSNAEIHGKWDYAIIRDVSELEAELAKHAGVEPAGKPFRVVEATRAMRWQSCIPAVPLSVAAGGFGAEQESLFDEGAVDWVKWDGMPTPQQGMFVAKITGDSMEPKVPAGSWCLFRQYSGGDRSGRDLVVSHQAISEAGFPVGLTLKRYRSEKVTDPATGEIRHLRITLEPLNPSHEPIEIAEQAGDDGEGRVRVVAELVQVIG
jgi:hypothetical protein